ncbi:protein strawberry notch homolog 1 isoform X1 [Octopus sinensis]|uniref:Protein strawberry notch homolog 1 isoform X1 n=1 Tax=Octopus sinensis TaxID=2607531 RepID=A0A6P7S4D2_9MOLL|nr:protein strawberry notch homolog 1 isoform X1 [Octopus sinensis]XP_029633050.1 protein strawberry notch homolog 1 isoform X1 [Octopus sinensis]XP_029633051.1 protein strawberry notch homolog 1 isoform X1 [Octopus sinensis]XP_036357022.1 protein strawberry notch homolog 1 isoform X1 [Octopus sinensis]
MNPTLSLEQLLTATQQQQQYEDNVRQMQLSTPPPSQTSAFSEPESLIPSLLSQLLAPPSPPLVSMASGSIPECSEVTMSTQHLQPSYSQPEEPSETSISSTDQPELKMPSLLETPDSSSLLSSSDSLTSTPMHQSVSSLTSLLLSSSPPPTSKPEATVSYSTASSQLSGLLSTTVPQSTDTIPVSLPSSSVTLVSTSTSSPSVTSTSTTITTTTTTTTTISTSSSSSSPITVQSPEAAIASIMSASSRMILQHQAAGLLSPAAAQQYLEMMRTRATNYATATTAVHQKLLDDLNEELGKLANDGVEESVSQEVFAKFEHREILPGCCSHPGDIVEAGSLASLLLPDAWYPLTSVFPPEKLKCGQLSSLQLEGILYACQKHQTVLPNGHRAGFFIGDGAGVGKGRQVSGIILDNYCRGRLRHIWFSISADLVVDARRDLRDIGCHIKVIDGCNELDRNTRVFGLSPDFKEGVVFSTYATLVSSVQRGALRGGRQSRLQQLINWCGGKDFDGCLIFDECHKAKNFVPGREHASTKVANAVMTIQRLLPKARVIYCSATGVSDVKNMAFMERLGLWGDGAPFPSFENFLDCMSRKGLGAAEMLAMEMKSSGMYVSRGLSFKQAEFITVEAELTTEQMKTYDIAAYIWNELRKALSTALHRTNCGNNRIWTQYWSSHQRFFKQLCMGMKVPTIIQHAQEALQQGHCVVIGLQTTGEASLENELGRNKGVTGFVSLCREILTRFIRIYFPTMIECGMNEERREDEWCKEAKSMLLKYASEIELPDSPLDSIIDLLGGPEAVAEMTGRRGRVVRSNDTGCPRYELRDSLSSGSSSELESLNVNERNNFMDGRKLVAIISDAASTGISLHADVRAPNQRRRHHLTIELPWSADKAVQQLGRSHRSNQSSGPLYKLVTTNLGGERRFAAAVARRLQSLGALTKGDRRAATGADLTEFNFDTPYGRSALRVMYQYTCMSELVPGIAFNSVKQNVDTIDNFHKILQDCLILMGIVDMDPVKFTVQVKKEDLGNVGKFLNRILGLPVMKQNLIFNYFIQCLDITIQNAKREGKYNEGLLDITASSVEMVGEPKEVFKDLTKGNTVTKLVVLNVDRGMKYEQALSMYENHKGKAGFYLSKGQPFGRKLCLLALSKDNSKNIFKVVRPNTGVSAFEMEKSDLHAKYSKISLIDAEKAWQEQHEATEDHCMHGRLCRNRGACTVGSRCYFMHLLCGSIITLMSVLEAVIARHSYQMHLSKAESSIRVVRIQLNNGERVVGIRYPERLIGEVEKVLREHQLVNQLQMMNNNSSTQTNDTVIPNFNSSSNKFIIEAASPVIPKYVNKAFTPQFNMHSFFKSNPRSHVMPSSMSRSSCKVRPMEQNLVNDSNNQLMPYNSAPAQHSLSIASSATSNNFNKGVSCSAICSSSESSITSDPYKMNMSRKRRFNNYSFDNCIDMNSNCKQQTLVSLFAKNTVNRLESPLVTGQQCPVCSMNFELGTTNDQINAHVDNCLL